MKPKEDKRLQGILDYWLMQMRGGGHCPPDILIAMCELTWPSRSFKIKGKKDQLLALRDAVDVDTGETAETLFGRDVLPRMLARHHANQQKWV
jgi:hypothetical protein